MSHNAIPEKFTSGPKSCVCNTRRYPQKNFPKVGKSGEGEGREGISNVVCDRNDHICYRFSCLGPVWSLLTGFIGKCFMFHFTVMCPATGCRAPLCQASLCCRGTVHCYWKIVGSLGGGGEGGKNNWIDFPFLHRLAMIVLLPMPKSFFHYKPSPTDFFASRFLAFLVFCERKLRGRKCACTGLGWDGFVAICLWVLRPMRFRVYIHFLVQCYPAEKAPFCSVLIFR